MTFRHVGLARFDRSGEQGVNPLSMTLGRRLRNKAGLELHLAPLWQLDTFFAYLPQLKFPDKGYRPDRVKYALDPLLLFTEVEKWHIELERTASNK